MRNNLVRSYENWSEEFVGKTGSAIRANALFSLAWFHAIIQERRNFIPQGWSKFYEFSIADLRAGTDILDHIIKKSGRNIQWKFIHGLFENAIFGGRVDNPFDMRVLTSYVRQFFNDGVVNGTATCFGKLQLPSSISKRDYLGLVNQLPDYNSSSLFGLPENIDRSSQRIISSQVIMQLRVLQRFAVTGVRFDKDIWSKELIPILNRWKNLNQGSQIIKVALFCDPG